MEPGRVLGHGNLGQVVEIGSAVERIKVGHCVCLPFNISCGFCRDCERRLTAFCLTVNPPDVGAAHGFADMGPFGGGQAEFTRPSSLACSQATRLSSRHRLTCPSRRRSSRSASTSRHRSIGAVKRMRVLTSRSLRVRALP